MNVSVLNVHSLYAVIIKRELNIHNTKREDYSCFIPRSVQKYPLGFIIEVTLCIDFINNVSEGVSLQSPEIAGSACNIL